MQGGDEANRLLLIPFGPGIGDVVMMEPLLRALRTGLPERRLTMVGRDYVADLLQPGGYELASPPYFVTRAPAALRPLHRLIPQRFIARAAEPAMALNLGSFGRVVNLFWAWESGMPFDRWWTPQWPPQRGVQHTLDLLADYLEDELGVHIPMPDRVPRLEVFPEAAEWAESYLRAHEHSNGPLASLIVSSANSLKWWAVPKWVDLAEWLVRSGWRVLLIAPQGDLLARQLYEVCGDKLLWPDTGLRRIGALLARSDVAVGIDTGPLHMAPALGTPWVGLFGPTNPDVIGPYDRSTGRPVLARFPKPRSCKDCWLAFKNRDARCPTLAATGCTSLIAVPDVVAAIRAVTSGTGIASSPPLGHRIEDD